MILSMEEMLKQKNLTNFANNGRTNNKEKLIFVGSNNLGQFKEIVSKAVMETKK